MTRLRAAPSAATGETTPRTMRAAVLTAPGRFEVRDADVPQPGPDEVRVRLEGCGVCASNIPPWEGRDWFEYPMPPGHLGHEGWGVIDAIGEPPAGSPPPLVGDTLEIGDHVALLSNHAYAQYDVAPANMVVKLPPALRDQPLPGEPLGCAVNIFKRSDIRPGQTVAIVGIGFLGALLTQMCRDAGARVIALSRREFSLDVARRMGAHETILMDDHWRVIERVAALTDGSGGHDVKGFCDRVIECTGKEWPLQLASELCAVRARLVIAGYHQDGMRSVNLQLWNWRGLDVINAHERDPAAYVEGIQDAARRVAAGALDPSPLYTHDFPLDALNEALHITRDRPDGFVKALVRMD